MKFIFVTGGVASSLGKGLASASLAALLQARGFKVCLRKLDPYLNVDPGTMNPYQHGEVFVTQDGSETDLDLGHYERFADICCTSYDYVTTGQIYSEVIAKERRGDYLGATIQVIPHITNAIKDFIVNKTQSYDFVICEIGGTVGDIEGLPYIEAIRQLRNDLGPKKAMFLHVTLLPYIPTSHELKTKPTQHSVKELLSMGIQPDILLCRTQYKITSDIKQKLALFCNVPQNRVIAAFDAKSIYHVPIQYHREKLDEEVCNYFDLPQSSINIEKWCNFIEKLDHPKTTIKIGIVGKYVKLPDAYKSIIEALTHGAVAQESKVDIVWIDSEDLKINDLKELHGILIPGGFGDRGVEGKIKAIRYARENNIPLLGICFGMQLAVIEASRNLLGLSDASSTELSLETKNPVISLLTEWVLDEEVVKRYENSEKGGTMRCGLYQCVLQDGSKILSIYKTKTIQERHRHRYEVNPSYLKDLESVGFYCSGYSLDGELPEIMERRDHPWFVTVQFHPEFTSKPFKPSPLFCSFIKAGIAYKNA